MIPALASLVLAIALGLGLLLWLRQREAVRREAFQALAARRGWALTIAPQSLGRPAVLRLAGRSGPSWQAETRRRDRGQDGQPEVRSTEFEADEPRWPEGLMLVGPGGTGEAQAVAAQYLDALEGVPGQKLLTQMLGERTARDVLALVAQPSPEGLTVLSSAPPPPRPNLDDIAAKLAAWDSRVPGDKGRPIMMLARDGLRVRLRHDLRRPEEMEAFVDYALDLARKL